MDPRSRVRGLLLVLGALAPGCTLFLTYEPPGTETSELACHDKLDNDEDGLRDCEDPSCVECVERPSVSCPAGWSAVPVRVEGLDVAVCEPPDDLLTTGCRTEAPPGVRVVAAGEDWMSAVSDASTAGSARDPVREVWLGPGAHVPTPQPVAISGHVAIRGLCDTEGGMPVLDVMDDALFPITTAPFARVELTHVALVSRMSAATNPVTLGGALTFESVHVRRRSDDADAVFIVTGPATLNIASSVIDPFFLTGGDTRSTITDSSLSGFVLYGGRATLEGVASSRSIVAMTPLAELDATNLYVRCGGVVIGRGDDDFGGTSATLRRSVIVRSALGREVGLLATGWGAFRSAITLEDVVFAGSPDCAPEPAIRELYDEQSPWRAGIVLAQADLDATRITVAGTGRLALLFDLDTIATLRDATLLGGGAIALGARAIFDRSRISGAEAAVQVMAAPGLDADVELHRTIIEDLSIEADEPMCRTPTAVGLALGPPVPNSLSSAYARASLESTTIRRVSGCGIFLAEGAELAAENATVSDSTRGVCAPSGSVAPSLLTFIGNDEDVVTDPAVCVTPRCAPPAGCMVIDEAGRCDNDVDDDSDGLRDCRDPDCASLSECAGLPPETTEFDCANGIDDDADNEVDCADAVDCGCHPACGAPLCDTRADLGSDLGAAVASGSLQADAVCWPLGPPSCANGAMAGAVAFSWTAPAAGDYAFDTLPSGPSVSVDTVVEIFDGDCGESLACDDNGLPGGFSRTVVSLAAGQRVTIVVQAYGSAGAEEDYLLNITAL
jgi:hypothetical protein